MSFLSRAYLLCINKYMTTRQYINQQAKNSTTVDWNREIVVEAVKWNGEDVVVAVDRNGGEVVEAVDWNREDADLASELKNRATKGQGGKRMKGAPSWAHDHFVY